MTGTISSTMATARTRWRQKARRRAPGRGQAACASTSALGYLAHSSAAPDSVGGDPEQHRQRDAADQRAPGQRFALAGLEAVTQVPDKMPDAAEQMMQQRPRIAEYDQAAEKAGGKGLHVGIGRRPRGRGDQP